MEGLERARWARRRPQRLAATLAGLVALAAVTGSAVAASSGSAKGVVNINTASVEELQLLPGIGKARADAILALRKQRGGFRSVEELREVKGIGDAMLVKLRPHVTLSGRTTARAAGGDSGTPSRKGKATSH